MHPETNLACQPLSPALDIITDKVGNFQPMYSPFNYNAESPRGDRNDSLDTAPKDYYEILN